MAPVLAYWFSALVVAGIAWPLAARLFRRFPDAGTGLALPLGLILAGTLYFLLRTFGILPVGRGGVIVTVAVLLLAIVALARYDRTLFTTFRRRLPLIIAVVGLFSAAFFGYTAFRSYNADIGGTEQPMDLLYLNATLESASYPPEDPWLAGERASYYYFGYLQSGLLTSLSGVESSAGYNLSLAMVFASSAAAAFSLSLALARWALPRARRDLVPIGGVLGVVFLLSSGSLLGVFEFTAAHEQYNEPIYEAFGAGSLLPCDGSEGEGECYAGGSPRTEAWYPDEFWFWWRASRIIPGAITEFPAFSFVLGDLHPHLMAIPAVLLAVSIAAVTWRGRGPLDWTAYRDSPWLLPLVAVVFGALAFQNTWDVLTFSALFALAVVARNIRAGPPGLALLASVRFLVPAGALAVIVFAPWWWFFSSQASGLYAYTGEGTRPAHALLQYGTLGIPALGLLVAARSWRRSSETTNSALLALWVPLLPAITWLALAVARGEGAEAVQSRGAGGWVTLAVLAVAAWLFASGAMIAGFRRTSLAAPLALATLGALLIYGSELLLVRDVFFGSVPRLNTVFKLTFQAWILLAIAAAVAVPLLLARAREGVPAAAAWLVPVAVVFVASLFYVAGALPNRTGGFENTTNIDGLASLARNNPDEYALTRWIAENTDPGTVVIEATGRTWQAGDDGPVMTDGGVDYSDAGRIASRTGRPTPIGWYFHEIQWRGDSEENQQRFSRRQEDVDALYLADDEQTVIGTMRRYDAEYVVVGSVERSRYPADELAPFGEFLDLAFESGDLRVYRLPVERTVGGS